MLRTKVENKRQGVTQRHQELLDRADYARERASSAAARGGGAPRSTTPTGAAAFTAGQGGGDKEVREDDEWVHRSREAWSTVLYQVRG